MVNIPLTFTKTGGIFYEFLKLYITIINIIGVEIK